MSRGLGTSYDCPECRQGVCLTFGGDAALLFKVICMRQGGPVILHQSRWHAMPETFGKLAGFMVLACASARALDVALNAVGLSRRMQAVAVSAAAALVAAALAATSSNPA